MAKATGAAFRIVELTPQQTIDLDALRAAVNSRTKVVAITAVSNAVGAITPIADVVRIVRAQSSAVIVMDGAQAVPHLPVSFDTMDVDFFAFSGHKMLGPMGIGGLIGKLSSLLNIPMGSVVAVLGAESGGNTFS